MRKSVLAGVAILASAGLAAVAGASGAQAATRAFLVTCTPSHSLPDDPIVVQNQPGASHLHEFFGNRGTNAYSTLERMQGVASSCPNGDRSAYWVPALYQNGKRVPPAYISVYYENRAMEAGTLKAFPPGFRMILGNSKATTQATTEGRWVFGCTDNTQIGGSTPPATCTSGGIQLRSQWPNCWDGKRGNGDDSAHVRFSSGGRCPAGFTIPLPTMRMNVGYYTGTTTGAITLSSGGGSVYSKHGDFINAWDQSVLQDLVDRCLNAGDGRCAHFKGTTAGKAAPADPTTSTASPSPSPSASATTSTAAPVVSSSPASPSGTPTSSGTSTATPRPTPTATGTARPTSRPTVGGHRTWMPRTRPASAAASLGAVDPVSTRSPLQAGSPAVAVLGGALALTGSVLLLVGPGRRRRRSHRH